MEMIPDAPMPEEWKGHQYSGPPVLFGHYWFTGTPSVISPRFACLDYSVAKDGVHVYDFQATLLHLLGVDHERLTYLFQGRRYRLTDVHGEVVQAILA